MKPVASLMHALRANLLLTLSYVLLGLACFHTGLHEQIAPLWLPAGLALAALLRRGPVMLSGVGAGSLLVNLAIPALYHDTLALHHVYAALVIAIGAAAQAWVAMRLLQRVGADPLKPARERWMWSFALYSGLAVCLINAGLGTLAVTLFNQSGSMATVPGNAATWWLGDSFGVLLGTPLFLALAAARHRRRQLQLALRLSGVLLAVLLINQCYLLHLSGVLKQSFAQDIQLLDARIQTLIQRNLRDLARVGQSLGALPEITAQGFREQIQPLLAGSPGLRAYSWDPLIQRAQRTDFEAQTRQQLQWPEYQVYGESPADRSMMIPVQFVEPLASNWAALGFNLYSLADRRRWVELAQTRGEAVATEVLYLTQAPDEPGLLVMQPVYRLVGDDLLNSRRELKGFVVGVFTVAGLLDAVQASTAGRRLGMRVSETSRQQPFYDTWKFSERSSRGLQQSFSVQLAQQEWQVDVRAGPDYLSMHPVSQAQYLQVLLVGVSALGALLILSMHHRERLLEARVRQQTDDLAWQALHDDLTGLQNRKGLKQWLERRLGQREQSFAILFIDLDRFKLINDSLGHQIGDRLLQALATALTAALPGESRLFRMGGDEFILLVPGDVVLAQAQARQVLTLAAQPYAVGEHQLQLTASIGISLFPAHGDTVDTLIKHADTAMYRAKSCGKNRFELYSREQTQHAFEHFSIEQDLRKAIHSNELVLYYQPQYALDGLRLCGYEALVRWQHPEQGFLGPDRFIPVAEETHLIVPLGWWVIESVCGQLADWQVRGQPLRVIAVNISPQQLLQADFIPRLNRTLTRHNLERRWLELEITESMIMQDPDFVIQQLQRLRMCGYQLALDDFGTGYSSLNRIKYLPLNRIKIDKSFVRDIGRNPKDEAVVISAIALGGSLGIEVLAEGVETVEQSRFLQQHGCSSVQGYLYGRPVPVEALDVEPVAQARDG